MTQEGLQKHTYDRLRIKDRVAATTAVKEATVDAWVEVRAVTDVALHAFLDRLAQTGWTAPEAGYELANNEGAIIATAELVWPFLKIAFLQENEQVYTAAFENAGWQSYALNELCTASDAYLSSVQKKDGQPT